MKILLIEDEKILSEMYKDKFSDAGHKMISVMTAEEGLIEAKKQKPNLIILDILLLKENGIFFLKERVKIPEIASIPVIVFSNFDDVDTKKQAYKYGVKDYLIKSNYTPEEFLNKANEYLKKTTAKISLRRKRKKQ
jgi:DNA-binding response OmpR family regulator